MKYYVLYCSFSGNPYEIGYGEEGLDQKFFDLCRDIHDFDKGGHSYDADQKLDINVLQFDWKEEVLEFLSVSRGITSFTSLEDYKRQQMDMAIDFFEKRKLIRL